jgi:MFS family permease
LTFGALQLLIEFLPDDGLTVTTSSLAAIALGGAITLWFWERRMGYPIVPVDMLVDRKLAALFAMSLLGGFGLFSLVFYVPLLFQGGYAMSPHDSGMLITPLVLGTTIGTVANNRIVTRIRRANIIMYVGFALFALASLSVLLITGTAPHLVWMTSMLVSGLGLGLVGANLTIFSQQIVPRDNLGAATALMQSLRTFGGMLGTAITGALLGQLYVRGVHRSLDAYQATQWFKSFASPELLIDRNEQVALVGRLIEAGHAGDAMMDAARNALVESIHAGLAIAAATAIVGLCLVWFVPPVRLARFTDEEVAAGVVERGS